MRGCIVGPDLSVLNLVVVSRGENAVPGLTDSSIPRRLGPKRASKVRKLFNLSKEDDLTKYVIARKFENKKGKTVTKRPKIQRLVTPLTLQVRLGLYRLYFVWAGPGRVPSEQDDDTTCFTDLF